MTETVATPSERAHRAAKRYIYAWGGGRAEGNNEMKDLLGGKGAGLAEMTSAGLPTPPGFTITTEACNDYFAAGETLPAGLWDDVLEAVRAVELETGKGFGDPANPLLVSVRSGAKFSMPGMMDTVLNLGLNERTLEGLIALTGNERFGWDAYRRFIQMFGRIVMGVGGERFDEALEAAKHARGASQDTDLDASALREVVAAYRAIVREETGREFPADPNDQLDLAIKAVFASWFGKRARDYRENQKIAHDLGTAVNVVSMVFGNMGDDSGTGVAFTRDPNTGEKVLYGEYLTNAQGEDVVAGIRTPQKIAHLAVDLPAAYEEFQRIADRLEHHYRDVQDLEFTIERGRLYMLQTRSAKRTAAAAVKIATDMVAEGVITKEEALARIEPAHVDQLLRDQYDPAALKTATRLAKGLNASPGAAVGQSGLLGRRRRGLGRARREGRPRPDRDLARRLPWHGRGPGDPHRPRRGDLATPRWWPARSASRASPVAPSWSSTTPPGRPGAPRAGPASPRATGSASTARPARCSPGPCPTVSARFEDQPELQTILGYADAVRRMGVWTNADKPEEAAMARRYGAQGIGLCRTEHMFREGERLEIVRGAILVANVATRAKARLAAGETLDAGGHRRDRDVRCRDGSSSRSSSRATSRGSSGRWTACRSSSGSSTRRSTSSCPTTTSCSSRSPSTGSRALPRATPTTPGRARSSPSSSRCASRTRCSACAAVGWA